MNAILEQINSAGYAFVEFALPMLVQSSVLIVILLSLDFVLKKKVRAVFRYCIWMLVLVKLVLPSSLSSPVSFGYWFGVELPSIEVTDKSAAVSEVNMLRIVEPASIEVSIEAPAVTAPMMDVEPAVMEAGSQPVVTSVAPVAWQGVVFLVWLAVVVVMGLLLLQRAIFVSGLVAQAKEPSSLMDDALKYCCRCIGIRGKIGLKVSANATSPAVCGLFRPVILVPENLGPSLGAGGLRVVLIHELAHIKRGDLWVNLVQTVLQIIYFYNPLLWLANAMIRRVREQAVDETVQVAMGEKAGQYPETLVNVAKLAFKRPALSLRLIGVVESKSALKGRVRHMLNRPIPRSAKLGLVGLLAVIIIGAVLLPMAKAVVGPPELVIKGTVTDAETGEPIAGAKVFDDGYGPEPDWTKIQRDKQSEWGAITNSAGKYSFLTWPEHHSIKVEAPAYKAKKESLYSGHFTLNKKDEEIFDFALEREQSSDRIDYSSVTVTEGVGFDEITVGDVKCTGEFIKSKLGQPDEETEQWLNYIEKLGLDFWFDKQNVLREIRLNGGFKGKLASGISMSSTMKDVFDTYGKPISEKVVDDLTRHFENQVLYKKVDQSWLRKSEYSKIFYNQNWLLFWFEGERISQIVVYRKTNKADVEVESKEQSKTKDRVKSAKETKAPIEQNLTNEAVYRQLEGVVELSGLNPEMAFAEAIEEIRNSVDPPLRIVVMWRDLFDNADIDQTTPINMDAIPAVRLVKGLKLLLDSVSGGFAELGFVVEDGVIIITTKESPPAGLETRVYDISKLVKTFDEANDLGLLIIRAVAPESWYGAGGEGMMIPHQDKKLVVSQTYEIHRKIQKLLAGLRTSSAVKVKPDNANAKAGVEKASPERNSVRLVVGGKKMTFEGQEVSFEELPALLEKIADREHTVFEIGLTTKKMPYERYAEAKAQAGKLVEQLGFEYLSEVGVQPLGSKGGSSGADKKQSTAKARKKSAEPSPIGKWESVDFVQEIEDFELGKKLFPDELFLKKVKFMRGGRTSSFFTWGKGWIVHEDGKTRAQYHIKEIGGSTYLFLPWLSGDVTERGQKPRYYVMRKVEAKKDSAKQESLRKEVEEIVEQAVLTISTCAADDPKVEKSLESLKGLDEQMVVKEVARFLDSDRNTIRRSAIFVLWNGEFESIKLAEARLLDLCSHEEEQTRGMAAIALGAAKANLSFDALCDVTLNDSSGYARRCAAYALGLLGRADAKDVLEKALEDPELLVRNNAEAALTMLSQAEEKKTESNDVVIKGAVESALAWLELIDDGDYEESWEQAAGFLKKAVGKEQFRQSVGPVRKPLGKVTSRKVKSKTYTRQVPGAPDGEYVVIQFETAFENKKAAIETVTPMLDKDGKWRVSGYYVR